VVVVRGALNVKVGLSVKVEVPAVVGLLKGREPSPNIGAMLNECCGGETGVESSRGSWWQQQAGCDLKRFLKSAKLSTRDVIRSRCQVITKVKWLAGMLCSSLRAALAHRRLKWLGANLLAGTNSAQSPVLWTFLLPSLMSTGTV
jgi:hypothetical protein